VRASDPVRMLVRTSVLILRAGGGEGPTDRVGETSRAEQERRDTAGAAAPGAREECRAYIGGCRADPEGSRPSFSIRSSLVKTFSSHRSSSSIRAGTRSARRLPA
jgi:hypothetical protein